MDSDHILYLKQEVNDNIYEPKPDDFDIVELSCVINNDKENEILKEFAGRLIICGGYACDILTNREKSVRDHRIGYNDIDLYLIDGNWEDVKKIIEYYKPFSAVIGKSVIEFVHLTIRYQIILRHYSSYSEIFASYDMSQCCVGYNGKKIFCTKIADYSIKNKAIVIFGNKIKHNWCERVFKYRSRGFKNKIELYGDTTLDSLKQMDPYNAFGECEILDFADNKGADFEICRYIYLYRGDIDYANITVAQFKALYGVDSADTSLLDFWL